MLAHMPVEMVCTFIYVLLTIVETGIDVLRHIHDGGGLGSPAARLNKDLEPHVCKTNGNCSNGTIVV